MVKSKTPGRKRDKPDIKDIIPVESSVIMPKESTRKLVENEIIGINKSPLIKSNFCQELDTTMIKCALKTVKKESDKKDSAEKKLSSSKLLNCKRAKKVDENFEKKFRELSIDSNQEGP